VVHALTNFLLSMTNLTGTGLFVGAFVVSGTE
jgi:hypothetical protein